MSTPFSTHKLFAIAVVIASLFHLQLAMACRCYLFIGSYNYDMSKAGIYVYSFDAANGALKKVSEINDVLNPAYLIVSPDGNCVYACTETRTPNAGAVSSYYFDADKGKLSFINVRSSGGENPVWLTEDKTGKWLVNANYTEGSVSVYPIEADGSIGAARQVISFKDSSINRERQDRSHIHQALFSPDDNYVFLPDLGADKIRCYAFDPAHNEPLQPSAHPFNSSVPGSGTRHMAFSPGGKYAYCIEEMAGCITAYSYANGRLDSIQRVPAHKRRRRGGYSSADVHVSPDGRFLYATNRGRENNIAIFSIAANGTLRYIASTSVAGNHPRDFVIDPSGHFVIVANQISGNVVVFRRDAVTGMMSKTGVQVKIRGASCVQLRQY